MLRPIGLAILKIFRYCGTFSLDRRVRSHLSHGLLEPTLPPPDTDRFVDNSHLATQLVTRRTQNVNLLCIANGKAIAVQELNT